jgi:hypothetical protein
MESWRKRIESLGYKIPGAIGNALLGLADWLKAQNESREISRQIARRPHVESRQQIEDSISPFLDRPRTK